jgi:hypothetical protein
MGETFEHACDFGGDWQHEILFKAILLPETDSFHPRCIGGARNGPPEEAGFGGNAGYLEALADPEHEEHENMLAWRGPFDPEAFSLDTINASLNRAFHRRAAARRAAPAASTDPEVDHRTKFMLAALRGEPTAEAPKKRIAPGCDSSA